ncbi:ROK family protein [Brevundimonas sp.]|uniref:ROK family protein n=1 Tax=Brevundimonas sp. TaxID=1871086 RepID=UPI003AF4637F
MSAGKRPVAGVELGGTKCVAVLGTGPDDVRDEVRIPTATPDETLGRLADVLAGWSASGEISAVGVASFGPLQLDPAAPDHGRIVRTPKPGWSGADLTRLMIPDRPFAMDTDVTGAALAEARWGRAQGLASHIYITVGTGVGVGIIVNGNAVGGLGHSEAGHLRVGRLAGDTWPGACTFHGDCVEGLASGAALAARLGQSAEILSETDPVWETVVHALAGLMHNLVLTATPQRILLGGGVVTGKSWLLTRLRDALSHSLAGYAHAGGLDMGQFLQSPGLGDRAGPMGALALGLESMDKVSCRSAQ